MLTAGQAVFNPTGGPQDWEIPDGVKIASITLVGGLGGTDGSGFNYNMPAAQVQGTLTWPAGTTALNVWVGGNGGNATGKDSPGAGGFNGGAQGGTGSEDASAGGGGGGATDIRIAGYLLDTRVMVAGGSGGAGGTNPNGGDPLVGGNGGTGGAGTATAGVWPAGNGASGNGDNAGSGGAGGQIAGGQSTVGGSAGDLTTDGGGGGGAGGYLGGAGGDPGEAGKFFETGAPGGGGGGGSSYADPALVTNATASLANNIFSASATIQWVHISTTSLGFLEQGDATQQQLQATYPDPSATTVWQVTSGRLPAGLQLSQSGNLTGTPTTAGPYSFTVTVTAQPNAVATSTHTYTGDVATLPGQPTNLQGTPGYESVNLSWTAPSGTGFSVITGYAIQYSPVGSGLWLQFTPNTGSSATTFTANTPTTSAGYRFRVAAINAAGTGSYSAPSAIVVPSGVKAVQTGTDLAITVNGGSVAYFRREGESIQIADNASFSFAQSFAPATVTTVNVAGNATNAGFVFTAGNLDASLTTTAISSLSFGSTAAFNRTVQATLTGGPLLVSGAVRGLGGVTLDGVVRLANDVEIDGGVSGVTMTGAVDGQSRGGQSLTVTALGAIVFQKAVGANVPLKSLETRAARPLRLSTDASQSRAIPLHYLPYTKPDGSVEDKYGIEVAVGNNPGRMYEFDTGGTGFWAGYNPEWWQGVVPPANAPSMHNKYTSGNYFDGLATDAVLTLGSGAQKVSTGGAVQITAITAGGNSNTGATFDFSTAGKPPIEGSFFGDFGASFGIAKPQDDPAVEVTNPLLQLPGNLSSGFVVQLGPLGTSPRLVVGITDDLRAQFPTAIELERVDGQRYPNPNGAAFRRQVYEQFAFSGNYTLARDGEPTFNVGTLPTLIDSGAPSTTIHYPDSPVVPSAFVANGWLKPGTMLSGAFTTTPGSAPLTWNLAVGNDGSVNAVEYTTATSAASKENNVNTGLDFYNGYDVMFDVATGHLRLRPSGGLSTVQVGSVTTLGAQRYGQNALLSGSYATGGGEFSVAGATTLDGGVTVTSGPGAVTFSGSVDSSSGAAQPLAVNSSAATRFVRPVGGTRSLSSLTTDAPGTTSAVAVTTTGAQSFGDAATLAGIYTTHNAPFAVAGAATLAGAVMVQTTGVDGTGNGSTIRFSKSIDSRANAAFPLVLDSGDDTVTVSGAVGTFVPLGGISITSATTATFASTVRLDGSGFGAAADGLEVADGVAVSLAAGGSIRRFTGSGVVFDKESKGSLLRGFEITDNVYDGIQIAAKSAGGTIDYTGTVIEGNAVHGNGAFGIEVAGQVRGLTIRGNTIGREGVKNPWNYVSGGPNTHGIVLAPGSYSSTTISGNTIRFNRRSGIMMPGGVQGAIITGNTIERNTAHGIEVATGDFAGTTVTSNTIRLNGGDGISLGAGIGQGTATGGNPDTGYAAAVGHYLVQYANAPNFYDADNPPPDPKIAMQVGSKQLAVNLDTGSRGLYFDALQLDKNIVLDGPKGHVFLNSSNRLYFGTWSNQTITFTQSSYVGPGGVDTSRKATANVPILVVTAIGASTTPAPGTTVANTTFGTTIASGTITITNGTLKRTVGIVPNASGGQPAGTVTIPGGWWATYADNMVNATTSKLAPVANFGIGFDRSGQGTAPTTDSRNQLYNAFLNLTEMQAGTMRPGYVISATGVKLGLDRSVGDFAYTALAPTGLPQGGQSAPDWQPATGSVEYASTPSGTGQIVIDMGIPSGILTLPGKTSSSKFGGTMTVNLLNSGGAVQYGIDTSNANNLLNPTNVAFFNPLAGTYTENLPPQSQQFFNTGRKVFAAFDYLYDAAAGFFGLRVGSTPDAQNAFANSGGQFTKGFYPNPNAPAGVMNLTIGGSTSSGNTIAANDGNGVTVNGSGSTGNAILFNSIFANGRLGIDLANGGNASQVSPALDPVMRLVGEKTFAVTGTLAATAGYAGTYQVQFFASPYADGQTASSIEGRTFLGETFVSAGPFTATLPRGTSGLGDWITATATPVSIPPNVTALNTSEFSNATRVMTAVVDTAADAGPGSLRSAIGLANVNPGGEAIEFAIAPVLSPATITLATALPTITGPLLIDGRTQQVTVSGARVAGTANGFTVTAAASQAEIRSLTIEGFARGSGIWSAAANAVFNGNELVRNFNGISLVGGAGTTVSGNAITASGNWGVYATGSLAGTSLVNNRITSTVLVGIYLQNATGIAVGRAGAGNQIKDGTARGLYSTGIYVTGISTGSRVQANTVSNNGSGVMLVSARGVLIGGTNAADGNTITGNRGYGLFATGISTGSSVRGNTISGNGRNVLTARAFGLLVQN